MFCDVLRADRAWQLSLPSLAPWSTYVNFVAPTSQSENVHSKRDFKGNLKITGDPGIRNPISWTQKKHQTYQVSQARASKSSNGFIQARK
jgi:hypothetical protein